MNSSQWLRISIVAVAVGLLGNSVAGCSSSSGAPNGEAPPNSQGGGRPAGGANADGRAGATAGDAADSAGGSHPDTAAGGSTQGGASESSVGGGDVGGSAGSSGQAAAGSPGIAAPHISKDSEVLLSKAGLTVISFGGYLNGESHQEEGILTFQGYQYTAFWNASRHVVLARRVLPSGTWLPLEFTDYSNGANDAHNTISIGICPADGTIHLSFDHHVADLHYRKSVVGLATSPATATWATSSFSAVTNALVGNTTVTRLTYPKFVTEPGGKKMLFDARIGSSGSGDEYLWEYDGESNSWVSLGMYVYGTINSINAYLHGLSYAKDGSRLHMSWCWRDSSNASSNHDLLYIYSDDNGRTWKNDAGVVVSTTGKTYVTQASPGIKVWSIGQNRGLINQEHMAVDPAGRVHVLLAHLPDAAPNVSDFDTARTKTLYFHYMRDIDGAWKRTPMGFPSVLNFRGKLALSSSGNLYAILPDLRIASASVASNFSDWALLDSSDSGRFFSDPLIDTNRLLSEDKLTIFYPQKGSSNVYILDYSVR